MNTILTHKQILQKVKRISFEVVEKNLDACHICLVGLNTRGFGLAKLLKENLQNIAKCTTSLVHMETPGKVDLASIDKESVVILVDDVLNSGATLAQAIIPLVQANFAKIEVAVLADRNHRKRPIKADYVGISMATTLQEHIHFNMENPDEMIAYLT